MLSKIQIQEIYELISYKQEGAYWDFKKEWYAEGKLADLLHDIICMANNMENRDAFGRGEKHQGGVRNGKHRINWRQKRVFWRNECEN